MVEPASFPFPVSVTSRPHPTRISMILAVNTIDYSYLFVSILCTYAFVRFIHIVVYN